MSKEKISNGKSKQLIKQAQAELESKNKKASVKSKWKNFLLFVVSMDVDWIFIALFTFLILNINIVFRILGSIGASYIYKMIMSSIKQVIILRK